MHGEFNDYWPSTAFEKVMRLIAKSSALMAWVLDISGYGVLAVVIEFSGRGALRVYHASGGALPRRVLP